MSEREMSEQDTQHSLGKLIDENAKRDAIHIAVAPVVSTERLSPGQRIGLVGHDNTQVRASNTGQGIVDPFLSGAVFPGDRFYMWLTPNTITSLRHQWTHPSFEPVEIAQAASKEISEKWLRDFIARSDCPDYETLLAAAVGDHDKNSRVEDDPPEYPGYYNSSNDGEYLHFGGRDAHGEIPPEFWDHIEVVTGKKITRRATYFSCSC